jgi:hypothetical protein
VLRYQFPTTDPTNHYWAIIEVRCNGQLRSVGRDEFWYRYRSGQELTGGIYMARRLEVVNQRTIDTYYREDGQYLYRVVDGVRTDYTYHDDGSYTATVVGESAAGETPDAGARQ